MKKSQFFTQCIYHHRFYKKLVSGYIDDNIGYYSQSRGLWFAIDIATGLAIVEGTSRKNVIDKAHDKELLNKVNRFKLTKAYGDSVKKFENLPFYREDEHNDNI